jgi:capsular exopolysaccharide synthesis family protein
MQENKNFISGDQQRGNSIANVFSKYFAYYPLILASLAIFIGVGYYYTRITPPKYQASTLLMIKNGSGDYSNGEDLISNAMGGKQVSNIKREIIKMTSGTLMERVVAKYGFNTSYLLKGRVLTTDVYKGAPFKLIIKKMTDSLSTVRITVTKMSVKGGVIEYGDEDNKREYSFTWNTPFTFNGNTYILAPKEHVIFNQDVIYIAQWKPVSDEAGKLSSKFSVKESEKESEILALKLVTENANRSADILDAICTEYNLSDIEERNQLSESTVRFIDERLNIISGELKSVEGNLENYQGSRNLINIESQANQSFENTNTISNNIKQISIQQGIVAMISGYFNNPSSAGKLVPSSMGLEDPTLAALIAKYNELQLRKDREAPLVGPNNLMIQDLDNQLGSLKNSILESLSGISRSLRLQESSLQGHNSQYRQFLASLPHNERVMQEIKRKQGITEGLYLYLLQKREEAAISSTSASISHYKQLYPAYGYGPVEPNKLNIYMCATLLGLLLPIGFVYIKDLFYDKISTREEITSKLSVPVIGDIVHTTKIKNRILSPKSRNLLSEQFRLVRTNLSFLYKGKNVFLITSTVAGEGKSTVSMNLASVLAMPGKKVALLEFDIRKPTISSVLGYNNSKGITDFLNGDLTDLSSICCKDEQIPTLHVFPSGPLPSNPADVLLSEKVTVLFEKLKQEYDYLIVDSAPAGMVSDAFLLDNYCDATLFVVRQRYTDKKHLEFINDLNRLNKLKNMAIILNDVKTGGRFGYYGYGYDNENGYYESAKLNGKKIFTWRKRDKVV